MVTLARAQLGKGWTPPAHSVEALAREEVRCSTHGCNLFKFQIAGGDYSEAGKHSGVKFKVMPKNLRMKILNTISHNVLAS